MKPIFTVHAGEYLVGDYIERSFPRWNVWVPSKDTGVDLLVTDMSSRKAVSLQVKFSKDYNPTHRSPLLQSRLLAGGWWTHDAHKIRKSNADFWVFVLPSFVEKETSFVIIPPTELLRRFKAIHGAPKGRIHSYLRVTKTKRCWEARGLPNADQELIALDRFTDENRDFTLFLNAWKQIGFFGGFRVIFDWRERPQERGGVGRSRLADSASAPPAHARREPTSLASGVAFLSGFPRG